MNILSINVNEISLRPPRKYDDSLYCRIEYADKKKTLVDFPNLKLVQYRNGSNTICIKSSAHVIKHVVEIEQCVLDLVAQNLDAWFDDRIAPEKLDSNFHSCATFLPGSVGNALKLKLATKPDADTGITAVSEGEACKMRIQLYAIRFSKNAFQLVWKLQSIEKLAQESALFQEEDEDYEESLADYIGEYIDVQEIYHEVNNRILSETASVEKRLSELRDLKKQLDEAMTKRDIDTILTLADPAQ